MPKTQEESPEKLLRRALSGLDAHIAELQERRAQLAALAEPEAAAAKLATVSPGEPRKMSAAARAKISAAAKARWAKLRRERAKKQTPQPTAKKAQSKGGKAKRAATKKSKARPAPAETQAG